MRGDDDPPSSGPWPPATPGTDELPAAPLPRAPLTHRAVALIEVLLCSDYPTQAALAATFTALGYGPFGANGDLRVGFVVALSLLDTALLVGLMVFFLYAHGEQPRDVFLGHRGVAPEARYGVPLIFLALTIGIVILATIQRYYPSLHTVEKNPLQALIRTPRDAWLFALIVVVAGGVREELQRAFLLHRFEVWLGGATVGVIATSIAFGAGHLLQGVDAAIATGTLGAFWGIVYLRRRSVIAPVVSHSGFNLIQIAQFLATGR
ncbi:MAG: type II CAAX endopeptidase family protein [Acidobacteriota bacterium]